MLSRIRKIRGCDAASSDNLDRGGESRYFDKAAEWVGSSSAQKHPEETRRETSPATATIEKNMHVMRNMAVGFKRISIRIKPAKSKNSAGSKDEQRTWLPGHVWEPRYFQRGTPNLRRRMSVCLYSGAVNICTYMCTLRRHILPTFNS